MSTAFAVPRRVPIKVQARRSMPGHPPLQLVDERTLTLLGSQLVDEGTLTLLRLATRRRRKVAKRRSLELANVCLGRVSSASFQMSLQSDAPLVQGLPIHRPAIKQTQPPRKSPGPATSRRLPGRPCRSRQVRATATIVDPHQSSPSDCRVGPADSDPAARSGAGTQTTPPPRPLASRRARGRSRSTVYGQHCGPVTL